jgi:ribonucleoside-diphosphate reductase beta chain
MMENPRLWTPTLHDRIYEACRAMVDLEDAFIDSAFTLGHIPGLTATEVKQYVRYTADRKLIDLRLDKMYHTKNPLLWLETMVNAKEHTNFFENRATEYAKGAVLADW